MEEKTRDVVSARGKESGIQRKTFRATNGFLAT